MTVGFVRFADPEQIRTAVEVSHLTDMLYFVISTLLFLLILIQLIDFERKDKWGKANKSCRCHSAMPREETWEGISSWSDR